MKSINHNKSVLFCIGNVARQDDGLGWAFADAIEQSELFKGEIYRNYQLNIEDAETASNAETVVFVDAFQGEAEEGFIFEECKADGKITFTTHALSPYAILALTNDLFQKFPQAYVLKIKGESWELGREMLPETKESLRKAITYFKEILKDNKVSKLFPQTSPIIESECRKCGLPDMEVVDNEINLNFDTFL